ncbi:MAG: nucleoside deaminase, partial [Gemmatimonadaceae bacterium]
MVMHASDADLRWMSVALSAAREALDAGEVPVGAAAVRGDELLATAANRTIRDADPTAHAELLASRAAARVLGSWRLDECTVYV